MLTNADELEPHAYIAALGEEDLEMWEAWARGNSSRPGEFDLRYASPMESNAHPGALAVVEGEGLSRSGGGGASSHILTSASGLVPALNEQEYLSFLWAHQCRQRAAQRVQPETHTCGGDGRNGGGGDGALRDGDGGVGVGVDVDRPISANHAPPVVRRGSTLRCH
jgi:hypothetical protein